MDERLGSDLGGLSEPGLALDLLRTYDSRTIPTLLTYPPDRPGSHHSLCGRPAPRPADGVATSLAQPAPWHQNHQKNKSENLVEPTIVRYRQAL